MHLMQMDVDADSQHTVDLLTKSASMHAAPCSLDAAGSSRDLSRAGSGRGPSNLRHASGPDVSSNGGGGAQDGHVGAAGAAAAGAAGGGNGRALPTAAGRSASGGFSFKMFGKDVGAAGGGGGGSAALQVGCCWSISQDCPCVCAAGAAPDSCCAMRLVVGRSVCCVHPLLRADMHILKHFLLPACLPSCLLLFCVRRSPAASLAGRPTPQSGCARHPTMGPAGRLCLAPTPATTATQGQQAGAGEATTGLL